MVGVLLEKSREKKAELKGLLDKTDAAEKRGDYETAITAIESAIKLSHDLADLEKRKVRLEKALQEKLQGTVKESKRNKLLVGLLALCVLVVAGFFVEVVFLMGGHEKQQVKSRSKYSSTTSQKHVEKPPVPPNPGVKKSQEKLPRLYVNTTPAGSMDSYSEYYAATYQRGMELKAGRYHIEVSHKGYDTQKKWVFLKLGETKTFSFNLETGQSGQHTATDVRFDGLLMLPIW